MHIRKTVIRKLFISLAFVMLSACDIHTWLEEEPWVDMSDVDTNSFLEDSFVLYPEMEVLEAKIRDKSFLDFNWEKNVIFTLPNSMVESDWLNQIALEINQRFVSKDEERVNNGHAAEGKKLELVSEYTWEMDFESSDGQTFQRLSYDQENEYYIAYLKYFLH